MNFMGIPSAKSRWYSLHGHNVKLSKLTGDKGILVPPQTFCPQEIRKSMSPYTIDPIRFLNSQARNFPKTLRESNAHNKTLYFEDTQSLYSALKTSYDKLLEEHQQLKSKKLTESSFINSSLLTEVACHQQCQEIEDLHEVLSSSHESLRLLIVNLSVAQHELDELRRKHSHLQFLNSLHEATNKTRTKLIKETIAKKAEELIAVKGEVKGLDDMRRRGNEALKRLGREIEVTDNKLSLVSVNAERDLSLTAELYQKTLLTDELIILSGSRISTLEQYIKQHK